MNDAERETRLDKRLDEIDDYLKGSMKVPEEDENENYQFYSSPGIADYHVHDKEELETDEQYLHFLMDLPLDEKAKLYGLWEQLRTDERTRFTEAANELVMQKTMSIAKNLVEWGMNTVDIAKVTGLTADMIQRLSKTG